MKARRKQAGEGGRGLWSPDGSIDAVGVFPEGLQGCWVVEIPELNAVIPTAREEQVPLPHVPIDRVHLRCKPFLVVGSDVHCRHCSAIESRGSNGTLGPPFGQKHCLTCTCLPSTQLSSTSEGSCHSTVSISVVGFAR